VSEGASGEAFTHIRDADVEMLILNAGVYVGVVVVVVMRFMASIKSSKMTTKTKSKSMKEASPKSIEVIGELENGCLAGNFAPLSSDCNSLTPP
jgi:murein endopeptidase